MFEFIKNISPMEMGIIVLILIILFGSRLIIGFARTSGETVKEIKKIKKTFTHAVEGGDSKSSEK